MCGIVGAVAQAGLEPGQVDRVRAMARALVHRGPDGFGLYHDRSAVLASQRLAIIDPAHGEQPVANETGSVRAVFNGEIFNHRELRRHLRARGHEFRSQCDTEVLVHLYEEHGLGLVEHLDGQFAFALWDAAERRLLLARDRFGICPLVYTVRGGILSFASEVKALIAGGAVEPELDEAGLAQVVRLNCCIAPRTLFRGVSALPPAHLLVLDPRGQSVRAYWELEFPRHGERPVRPFAYYRDGVAERLEGAVRRATVSDAPVGTFLSGGIDSGAITLLSSRARGSPLPAYTVTSPHRSFDESDGAARVSALAGASLHKVLADDALIARQLRQLVWHAETPVLSTEAAALLALSERAHRDVKVVLTGEGADEAFAGYAAFRQQQWISRPATWVGRLGRALVRPAVTALFGWDFLLPAEERLDAIHGELGFLPAQLHEYELYRWLAPLVFREELSRRVLEQPVWSELGISRERVAGRHWLDQSLYLGYRAMLPGYLLGPHGDRVLMAHSVEGRYPFLDRELVEFSAWIPPEHKLNDLSNKYVLRQAARAWLPEQVVSAPKRRFMASFGMPFLSRDAPEEVRRLLAPDTLRSYGYFDPERVQRTIQGLQQSWVAAAHFASPRTRMAQLVFGMAITLVASVQMFHHLFIERRARAAVPAGA
jgi:asparagine synthase (glutamine-hydrolysing)